MEIDKEKMTHTTSPSVSKYCKGAGGPSDFAAVISEQKHFPVEMIIDEEHPFAHGGTTPGYREGNPKLPTVYQSFV